MKELLADARNGLIEAMRREIVGPGSEFGKPDAEHELIGSRPTARYTAGILFPSGNMMQDRGDLMPVANADGDEDADEPEAEDMADPDAGGGAVVVDRPVCEAEDMQDGVPEADPDAGTGLDEDVSLAAQFAPSSMGITFVARGDVSFVEGTVSFGTYRRADVGECVIPYAPADPDSYAVPSAVAKLVAFDKQDGVLKPASGRFEKRDVSVLFGAFADGRLPGIPADESDDLKTRMYRLADYMKGGWIREPHDGMRFRLDFTCGEYDDGSRNSGLDGTEARVAGLRRESNDGSYSVTVMLVNGAKASSKDKAMDGMCLFQPVIEIAAEDNAFTFVGSEAVGLGRCVDDEELSLAMLYRDRLSYATGLGVSASWTTEDDVIVSVRTDFFPEFEVPAMDFGLDGRPGFEALSLSMKTLSDLDGIGRDAKLSGLRALADWYEEWIGGLRVQAASISSIFESAAERHISRCEAALRRMRDGISVLESDDVAYDAFMLANRAMFMQRVHATRQIKLLAVDADRYPGDPDVETWLQAVDYRGEDWHQAVWRPFQIAFILMNVKPMADASCPDRDIVDLIWFPTGGGKTEAYLGLTAFTIFHRRLAGLGTSGGTVVIMRYTLRLLAAQQFTRAATLICACEAIRLDCERRRPAYPAYGLGKEPISIGLWIGGDHTPNRNEDAYKHLDELEHAGASALRYAKDRHHKFQVLKCPWCGTKMSVDGVRGPDGRWSAVGGWGYESEGKNGHFYMHCTHDACLFRDRLPIQVVDDELYAAPPTLLFGTVDKFAMLPWEGRSGAFFGTDGNKPPDLVIQDELHLISGALGTMVGLYETAVDALCSAGGVRPKIVASTATIRRASEQCSALYARRVVQFPPSGLLAKDSFFARDADPASGKPGRRYVGFMPSGKTKAMAEIRIMAALQQWAWTADLPDDAKDRFWTLVAYFNNLKDLGMSSSMVDANVQDFIRRLAQRTCRGLGRTVAAPDELTSRISTTKLNETLDKLERLTYSKENRDAKRYASNVVLATNMISVGLDVARLNVMLVVGQPKLTSEYIQASSRVGRTDPGVVFVQYDASKSRDRSHYERFRPYHDAFYGMVEPTGVTPFSLPARQRGLHAVLLAMLRKALCLTDDKSAGAFDRVQDAAAVEQAVQWIVGRVEAVNDLCGMAMYDVDDVRDECEAEIDRWQACVDDREAGDGSSDLAFGRKAMAGGKAVEGITRLMRTYGSSGADGAKETMTSMRNVDTEVHGALAIWEDER